MHGAMGGGTNGAGHVNMGLPYKTYNAEQVSAMHVVVVRVRTEMAGYCTITVIALAHSGLGIDISARAVFRVRWPKTRPTRTCGLTGPSTSAPSAPL